MRVPLPTPDGPVITKTRAAMYGNTTPRAGRMPPAGLAAEHLHQLGALALGESADRLRRGDPALGQDLVRLDPAVLRDGEDHVEDLGGHDPFGRIEEEAVNLFLASLEIAFQLRPAGANVVRSAECLHPLIV